MGSPKYSSFEVSYQALGRGHWLAREQGPHGTGGHLNVESAEAWDQKQWCAKSVQNVGLAVLSTMFAPITCTRRNLGQISSSDRAKEDVDLTSWIQLIEHWATNILVGLKRQLDLRRLWLY
jgi:hypothetical protein